MRFLDKLTLFFEFTYEFWINSEKSWHTSRIRPYYKSDLIKSIAGIRRCGKSTILKQIIEELSERVSDDQIIFYDFEDFDNEHYLHDPQGFYHDVKNRIAALAGKKAYILIDEVQYMDRYIPIIASIRSALGASVFVTGSTSTLISGELADKLTGRYVEFSVFPFSYDEVVQFTSHDDEETLADYLKWGGFPVRFAPAINARTAIQDILSSIVERDILGRHPEFDRWNFRNFLSYILAYTSNRISTESLSTFISVNEKKISTTTCYKYLEAMREANLISMPVRFDIRRKEMLKTRRKSYATDPSLVTLQRGSTAPFDLGDILETVAYNELVSRGYEVHTGKTYNGEIDFVVTNRVKRCYIQVAYLLASEEVVEREFKAYSSVKDNWPKYVISLAKPDFSQRGIIHMNVRDFLTGRRKLAIGPCAICFRQSESR